MNYCYGSFRRWGYLLDPIWIDALSTDSILQVVLLNVSDGSNTPPMVPKGRPSKVSVHVRTSSIVGGLLTQSLATGFLAPGYHTLVQILSVDAQIHSGQLIGNVIPFNSPYISSIVSVILFYSAGF